MKHHLFWLWLLTSCVLLFAAGVVELVQLVNRNPNAGPFWIWLLGIPIGAVGFLWIAREMKN